MLVAYKYRLLPTEDQKVKLESYFDSCRFIYNLGLETKIAAWSSLRVSLSPYDLMKQMTELKRTECQWLNECNQQCLESALNNLGSAFNLFFKRGGFPNFKKKSGRQSVQFRRGSKVIGSSIRLGKIGFLDFIKHREIPEGEIRTVTVSKTPTKKYFVSILLKISQEPPVKKEIILESAIGVDLGLKSFAVLSDGTEYGSNKFFRDSQHRLRIEQRKLNRRFKTGVKIADQSKSWHKQRIVVALLHEKITNQRSDFLHKLSDSITKNFDTICLEDLNVTGMMKNRNLSKSIADASWGQFSTFLKYKAERRGKNLIYIDRFAPSSKTCSNCGELFSEMTLADRTWTCKSCGSIHDRDHNAAINIKRLGLEAKPSTVNVDQKVNRIGCESMPRTP